jgi:ADP-ribose pyrophosphatase
MDKAAATEEWDFAVFSVLKYKTIAGNTFSVLRCPDWVNVIAVTEGGQFVLVRQHRFGTQAGSLEFPGGIVDEGCSPLLAAMEELREETGFESDEWHSLGSYQVNPGLQNNLVHSFVCKGAFQRGDKVEAGMQVVLLDAESLTAALHDHGGALQQAFALASVHLAVQRGYIEMPLAAQSKL